MAHYSVAKAKDSLSALIAKAEAGEEVVITRHGKPAVELRVVREEKPDLERIRAAHDRLAEQRRSRPPARISAAEILRLEREDYRY